MVTDWYGPHPDSTPGNLVQVRAGGLPEGAGDLQDGRMGAHMAHGWMAHPPLSPSAATEGFTSSSLGPPPPPPAPLLPSTAQREYGFIMGGSGNLLAAHLIYILGGCGARGGTSAGIAPGACLGAVSAARMHLTQSPAPARLPPHAAIFAWVCGLMWPFFWALKRLGLMRVSPGARRRRWRCGMPPQPAATLPATRPPSGPPPTLRTHTAPLPALCTHRRGGPGAGHLLSRGLLLPPRALPARLHRRWQHVPGIRRGERWRRGGAGAR